MPSFKLSGRKIDCELIKSRADERNGGTSKAARIHEKLMRKENTVDVD